MSKSAFLPFSKVRVAEDLAHLSGELPLAENGSIPDGIAARTDLTLRRIGASLEGVALALPDVVQATAYPVCRTDFAEFNTAYRLHFKKPCATRTTVIAGLMLDAALIEIAVVAVTRDPDRS